MRLISRIEGDRRNWHVELRKVTRRERVSRRYSTVFGKKQEPSTIGRAIKSRRRGREKERDIAGGNRRGSCSWRRYASHETKLIEKKQFVEGRRGEEEEEEVKVLRQWRRRGGRPPERINTTLARRSNERVFRGSPNPIQEKKEKGGGRGFARLAVARMNNQTRRGRRREGRTITGALLSTLPSPLPPVETDY